MEENHNNRIEALKDELSDACKCLAAERGAHIQTESRLRLAREEWERIMSNINKLVYPCVDHLKQTTLSRMQCETIGLLEEHLKQILSPFVSYLTSPVPNLTPREIQVSNMVKNGKTNKEISIRLAISIRAVEFHRENIRRKLGLTGSKKNLRTHLITLS